MQIKQIPLPIFVQDYSAVKPYLETLHLPQHTDLEEYFFKYPEISWECLKHIKIIEMNEEALKFSGATNVNGFTAALPQLFTNTLHKALQKILIAILTHQAKIEVEAQAVTLNGKFRDIILNWKLHPDYSESLEVATISIFDITELKKLQDNLTQQTAIRTKEQHQTEKQRQPHQQQMNRIEHLNSMGELTSSLAHQLNQPLAIISSYAQETCRRLNDNDIQHQHHELINAAQKIALHANRAGEIVNRLREFFSMKPLQKQPEDVNQIIKGTILFLKQEYNISKKLISLTLDSKIPQILLDRTQIEQVLFNILQNAFDAVESKKAKDAKITISTAANNNALIVTISDTGVGVSEQILDNIFEPFFTTKSNGMGLGLAICRSIISAHDGQIIVSSIEGKGMQFKLTLPI
ncbi:MAG: GHKL domain-containing protein [Gammaproteobacteria bacterium]|nr:GHKL domain-containing protein [Gammaproteobacteria bacterium]